MPVWPRGRPPPRAWTSLKTPRRPYCRPAYCRDQRTQEHSLAPILLPMAGVIGAARVRPRPFQSSGRRTVMATGAFVRRSALTILAAGAFVMNTSGVVKAAQQQVQWTNPANVTVRGNALVKTGGC